MKKSFSVVFLMLCAVMVFSACGAKRAHCDAYGELDKMPLSEESTSVSVM
jgi:hypothetical protein